MDRYGVLEVFPSKYIPSINMPNIEIAFLLSKSGSVVKATNVNLNKKIISLIKSKRNQHKIKYNNFIKVYYFYVNCPPPRLDEINDNLIQSKLHDDEVLVLTAVSKRDTIFEENKKIFGTQKDLFDFSNTFYELYRSNNKKYIDLPFF